MPYKSSYEALLKEPLIGQSKHILVMKFIQKYKNG